MSLSLSALFNGWQGFSIGGLPLVGGFINTYLAGTSTPAATYTDSGGLTPNANPIQLDAAGLPPNEIWLTDGVAYKFVVTDSLGLSPRTYDNVTGIGAGSALLTASLAASGGSGLVGFLQAGVGAVARTAQSKMRDAVSVKDFGAKGDGITDDTAALQAAQTYLAGLGQPARLIFPAGIYLYSTSPNWAIPNASIEAQGNVHLRYTGTGNAVILDGGAATSVYAVSFGAPANPFVIEATSSAQNACYVRALHHSTVCIKVRGCGTTYAGLRTAFSVASRYWVTCSVNEDGWYSGAQPANGLYLSNRGVGEQTADCTFYTPIVEGVSGDGILLDSASVCSLLGGTSEGNVGRGSKVGGNTCFLNRFVGLDFEGNTGSDIDDTGDHSIYEGCYSTGTVTIQAGAFYATLTDCTVNAIVDNGTSTRLLNVKYGIASGAISGTGTARVKRDVFAASGPSYDIDHAVLTLENTASLTTATATTMLTLPSVGARNYVVTAFLPGTGSASNYNAHALIAQNLGSSVILSQTNGALLTITLVGQAIKATQSSGSTQTVTMLANPL
jgi:hypothetical protein